MRSHHPLRVRAGEDHDLKVIWHIFNKKAYLPEGKAANCFLHRGSGFGFRVEELGFRDLVWGRLCVHGAGSLDPQPMNLSSSANPNPEF